MIKAAIQKIGISDYEIKPSGVLGEKTECITIAPNNQQVGFVLYALNRNNALFALDNEMA